VPDVTMTVSQSVVQPGNEFNYTIAASCAAPASTCVDATLIDVIPAEFDVTSLPEDTSDRTVTYDESTRTLTVIFTAAVPCADGAPGTCQGLAPGTSHQFDIGVQLSAEPDPAVVESGEVVTNTATTSIGPRPAGCPPELPTATPPDGCNVANADVTVDVPVPETTEGDVIIFLTPDPTNTIAIDKTNTADGEPAGDDTTIQPGESYTYNFLASCSNITVNCVNLTVVDTFPADVIVDASTCASIPGTRVVTYDPETQTMTIVYVEPLTNPAGTTGKIAGTSDTCSVGVTLPADTTLEDGDVIENEATVSADNVAESATDPSNVIVEVPVTVDAGASKSFSDPSAIAGDTAATTTIQLGGQNLASNSATVNEMVIEESTPATWEYLNFTAATVTQYPAGAEQAQLFVCPAASAPCDDSEWVAGGTGTPPGPSTLALPGSVPADQVVGVRIVFTATAPQFIENVANGGTAAVAIDTDLRDTVRSTDQPIVEIPTTTIVNNTASVTVTDPGGPGQDPQSDSASANAQYQILPPTLSLDISKSFIPDGNGNFSTDGGEHAVIGENSGASMIMDATNTSAFPIAEISITEPSPNVASEFAKFNATDIRLTFPAGAATANVVVTYSDGTSTDTDYDAPGPGTVAIDDDPDTDPRVTSITVTYSGPDEDGDGEPDPTIEPGTTAGLDVHGNLNDGVDASDLASGVDNCANMTGSGGGVPGTTGVFNGNACNNLPIEGRNANTGGTKTNSQNQIPVNQPIAFQMTTTNNGNLPLFDLVVADPPLEADGTPPTPDENSVFFWGQLTPPGVTVTPAAMADRVLVEVYTEAGGWQDFDGFPEASYPDVIGVRGTIEELQPTETFTFNVFMISRDPLPPGEPPETLTNCYSISADTSTGGDEFEVQEHCSNPISPGPVNEAAVINKAIAPETVPERIPGMDPADAQARVTLQVVNNGDITARTLQITDNDADFWDAVDFVGFVTPVTPPAVGEEDRADQLQIDAFVDGAWVNGTPAAPGSPALPAGVTADEVRGLRFTFSDTSTVNDGFVLTPCQDNSCEGVVEFDIQPRLTLVSTGEPLLDVDPADGVPDELLDSATGAMTTRLHPNPADPLVIPEVTDNLLFRPGDPALDVNKGPEAVTLAPGQPGTFTLTTTNTGTANLPDLTVSDPLPTGILFDDTYADPITGQPFTVTWTFPDLPDDFPEPPVAVFETTPDPTDPTRVGQLRWTFPGWDMPPNSSVDIFYRYTLEPGVEAGQVITNTMGASSPVENLVCSDENDGQVTDGDFGDGLYCTDPAQTTVTAGANFASRKWVAGTPELGWYNEITGELVPVGGGGCLSLEANGRTYTTNPCIAITNPGEDFHYVLRVENAGTESALEMTIIDNFPVSGDTGVFGADRGTQWANRPTLAGPATYNGPSTGVLEYSTSSDPCAGDPANWPCDGAGWGSGSGPDTASLRMRATFDEPLPPGGVVDVYFSMTTPVEVPRVSDPTVAYNSLAHGEVTQVNEEGDTRTLAPLEPLRVGVATLYGSFRVFKFIPADGNPADLPLDDVEFEFTYECTLTNGTTLPQGTVTVTPTSPALVTGIPAGSTCDVWESDANGGIPVATEENPLQVVIRPSLNPSDPTAGVAIGINRFPLGELSVLKTVTGFDNPDFTGGPYPATVDCTFLGESVPGFPVDIELTPDVATIVEPAPPVGAVCTVTETDELGATTVTYDPANADGTAAEITVPSEEGAVVEVGITNDFPFGAVSLLKEVTGGVDEVFTGGPYPVSLDCTFTQGPPPLPQSVPGFPVVVELIPGEPSDSFVAPVGSVCTVTEIDDNGATTVTFDPANADGTAGEVVVPDGSTEAEPISITITNDFPDGGLQVNKAIGVNDADLVLDDLPYTFRYQCTFDPDPEVEGDEITSPDPPALLVATVNNPAEVNGLPAGAVCEVWETMNPGNQGGIPDATEENPAVVTIEAGTIAEPFTPVTVTNDYPSVPVELVKLVEGDAQEEFTGGPYTIGVTCWAADQIPGIGTPFPGTPVAVLVFANEPVEAELPVGTTCWFRELDIPEGVTVTYDPSNPSGDAGVATVPAVPPPDEGVVGTVSATNTFTTGSLVIEKEVSGPGVPAFSQGPFVFGVSCDYQGVEDVYSVAVVVPGSEDGTPVQSEPVTGLPIGATCTVTEIDNGGADIVSPPQTVTIEENEEANVSFVGVNNPFSAGTIAVAKVVEGAAGESDYVTGLSFTIDVECAVEGTDGALETVLDESVTVAPDGQPVVVTGEDGEPLLVPLGARCWGSEEQSFGATMASVDHDSYETGVEVVADAESGVQELLITATNVFDIAELTVAKEVIEEPDPNAVYTFEVACTIVDSDGTVIDVPLISGTSPVTLAGGESATFEVLAESTCTVTETNPPADATVTITESAVTADGDPADGTVTVDAETTVVVTNSYDPEVSPGGGETTTTVVLPATE
jgi:uncharacterized repeat protein (TIGR01451 family)